MIKRTVTSERRKASLKEYRDKRDFHVTTEQTGTERSIAQPKRGCSTLSRNIKPRSCTTTSV